MPNASQARLEFRLNIAFRQLIHAAELAHEYGDPGMANDLSDMSVHILSMHQDLLARTRRIKPVEGPLPLYKNK